MAFNGIKNNRALSKLNISLIFLIIILLFLNLASSFELQPKNSIKNNNIQTGNLNTPLQQTSNSNVGAANVGIGGEEELLLGVGCGTNITTNTTLTGDLINCTGDGIIFGANELTLDCNGFSITGADPNVGVDTLAFDKLTVKNCIVEGFRHGILFDGESNQAFNNTVLDSQRAGIRSRGDFTSIFNNTINNSGFNGIFLGSGADFNLVNDNIVTFSGNNGIRFFNAKNNDVHNNKVLNSLNIGIFLTSDSSTNDIFNNNVSNSTNTGIQTNDVLSSGNNIYNNYFDNPINAIDTSGTNNWNTTKTSGTNIIGNAFLGGNFWSDYSGVDTNGDGLGDTLTPYNSTNNIVNGGDFLPLTSPMTAPVLCGANITTDTTLTSDITGCNGIGVSIGDFGVTLDCNGHKITGIAGSSGVHFNGFGNSTVKNCVISGFGDGIHIISNNITAHNNTIINASNGALVSLWNHTIKDNIMINNIWGIYNFVAFNTTIKNNTITQNLPTDYGMLIQLAHNGTIENNTVSGYTQGIELFSSSENTIFRNTIVDNTIGYNSIDPSASDNLIYDNYFNNTLINAFDPATNSWNVPLQAGTNILGDPLIGGNFWSDYTGVDTDVDGIGDTLVPHKSGGVNILFGGDFFPLVKKPEFDFRYDIEAVVVVATPPDLDPEALNEKTETCTANGFGNVGTMDYDKFVTKISDLCNALRVVEVKKFSITVDSNTYQGDSETDIFLTDKNQDIYAWVVSEPDFEVHVSRKTAEVFDHIFDYDIVASGTESPPQAFDYEIEAIGKEDFIAKRTIKHTQTLELKGTFKKKCETGFVRMSAPGGFDFTSFKETGRDTKGENTIGTPSLSNKLFKVEVNYCNRGAWRKGWVTLSYELKAEGIQERDWSNIQKGNGGTVVNGEENKLITAYTGGFGTGKSDTVGGTVVLEDYILTSSNENVKLSMDFNTNELFAITFFTKNWENIKSGNSKLNESEGIKNITKHNVSAPNNDTVLLPEITVNCTDCPEPSIYKDINGDGRIDAGQFFAWMDGFEINQGPIGDILFVAMNATPPTGIIDNITPENISIFGENVTFEGHGEPINDTIDWFWRSHKDGQIGAVDTFVTNILSPANPHHIFFNVKSITGLWSPIGVLSKDELIVNKPPEAQIRFIEGTKDELGNIIALLGEPVDLNGFGFDTDGFINEHRWYVDGVQVSSTSAATHTFSGTQDLGQRVISYSVLDDKNTSSRNVSKLVTVVRNPVLLVHDYLRGPKEMRELEAALLDEGYEVFTADLRKPVDFEVNFKVVLKDEKFKTLGFFYTLLQNLRQLNQDIKELKAQFGNSQTPEAKVVKNKLRSSIHDTKTTLELIKFKTQNQAGLQSALDSLITTLDDIKMFLDNDDLDSLATLVDSDNFLEDAFKIIIDKFNLDLSFKLNKEIKITDVSLPAPVPEKVRPFIQNLIEVGEIKIPGEATLFSKNFEFKKNQFSADTNLALLVKNITPEFTDEGTRLKGSLVISDIIITFNPFAGLTNGNEETLNQMIQGTTPIDLSYFTTRPDAILLNLPVGENTALLNGDADVGLYFPIEPVDADTKKDVSGRRYDLSLTARVLTGAHYMWGAEGQIPGASALTLDSGNVVPYPNHPEVILATPYEFEGRTIAHHTSYSNQELIYGPGRYDHEDVVRRPKGDPNNASHNVSPILYTWEREWNGAIRDGEACQFIRHMDCSGTVYYVYNDVGIKVKRTNTEGYSKIDTDLDTSDDGFEVKPGDVCYITDNGQASGIHHIGIYVGEQGSTEKIVHAKQSSQGIVEEDFIKDDWNFGCGRMYFEGVPGLIDEMGPEGVIPTNRNRGNSPNSNIGIDEFPYIEFKLKLNTKIINLKFANQDIKSSAKEIGNQIDLIKEKTGIDEVNLVGSGMGAIASNFYAIHGYRNDVNKVALIGGQLHGSDLIKYGPKLVKALIKTLAAQIPVIGQLLGKIANVIVDVLLGDAAPQMEPHSTFLQSMNLNDKNPSPEWELYQWPGEDDILNNDVEYRTIAGIGPVIGIPLPLTLTTIHMQIPLINEVVGVPLIWIGDLMSNTISAGLDNVEQTRPRGLSSYHWWLAKDDETLTDVVSFLNAPTLGNIPVNPLLQTNETPPFDNDTLNKSTYQTLGPVEGLFNETNESIHEFFLDGLAEEKIFRLNYQAFGAFYSPEDDDYIECSNNLSLEIIKPDLSVITKNDSNNDTLKYLGLNGTDIFNINLSDSGIWGMKVNRLNSSNLTNSTIPVCEETDYTVMVTYKTNLRIGAGTTEYSYEPNDPVKIFAYLQYEGNPFSGANVVAEISKLSNFTPNESELPIDTIVLFDDGLHDDAAAGDGFYANTYTATALEDAYIADVNAQIDLSLLNISNETVNRSSQTVFFVELLPELTVESSDISFNPSSVNHGEIVTISATIQNIGGGNATNASIEFRDGLETIGFDTIDINGFSNETADITWNATFGNHTINVIISPFNEFQEKNYTNNNASVNFIVGDTMVPIAVAGRDITARVGDPVFFDGTESLDNNAISNYEWDVDINNPGTTNLLGEYVSYVAYNVTGNYTARLTVTDPAGNVGINEINVEVVNEFDFEEPRVIAGEIQKKTIREPVQFDGTLSRDNFGIASYIWDIDVSRDSDLDGIPDNDVDLITKKPVLESGYYVPGIYIVKLTVDDVAGNGPITDFTKVIVRNPEQFICVGDLDCDTVPDEEDNCPEVYNPSQLEQNKEGIGDACYCDITVTGTDFVNEKIESANVGSTICLVSNTNQQISIGNSFVKLDCLGYSIIGNGTDTGILLNSSTQGVNINNCNLENHNIGILDQGLNNRITDNTINQNTIGISSSSAFGIYRDNEVCGNSMFDISKTGGAIGDDNICNNVNGWEDIGEKGSCTFTCGSCVTPTSSQTINFDSYICGGTYVLSGGLDINGGGTTIKCNNTVLIGDGVSTGISSVGNNGIKIKGCELRNWSTAIDIQGSFSSAFENNRIIENDNGILLHNVDNSDITGNVIKSNLGIQLLLNNSDNNDLNDSEIENNLNSTVIFINSNTNSINDNKIFDGIKLIDSDSNTFNNNNVSDPDGIVAVEIDIDSDDTTLNNNEIHDSLAYGIIVNSNSNTFTSNAIGNVPVGYLINGSNLTQITLDTFTTVSTGLLLIDSYQTSILNIDVMDTEQNGMRLNNSNFTMISNSNLFEVLLEDSHQNIIANNVGAFELLNSDMNTLTSNNATNVTVAGYIISESDDNIINNNEADENEVGIIFVNSTNNTMNNNRFCSNIVYDINLTNSSGNSGDNNTCELNGGWNDLGDSGCTFTCSPDGDGDGVGDLLDNCPSVFNPQQRDPDLDGLGSLCDNCPNDFNPEQIDNDLDNHGIPCDCNDNNHLINPAKAEICGNGIDENCNGVLTDGCGPGSSPMIFKKDIVIDAYHVGPAFN